MRNLGTSGACRKLAHSLTVTPHCVRKISGPFALGEYSYLEVLSCACQTFSGASHALVLGPPDFPPSPCPLPLSCPRLWGTCAVSRREALLLLITYSFKSSV